MRKASIVLAIAACAVSSLSLAQHVTPPGDIAAPTAADTASAIQDDSAPDRGKSGFGQIMSVLTGLLQEAAGKEAAGASSTAPHMLSSDQSAVTITVTPVAGRSSLFGDKPAADRNSAGKEQGRPGPDNATPPARVATTTLDADTPAPGAQVAMQAEGAVPD